MKGDVRDARSSQQILWPDTIVPFQYLIPLDSGGRNFGTTNSINE